MYSAKEAERVETGVPAARLSAGAAQTQCGAACETCPLRLTCPALARLEGGRA